MTSDDKNLTNFAVFKRVAHKLYVEYLEKSITHGFRMIRRTEGDSYGRYIWLGFMVFIFVLTHLDVYRLAIQFMQAPTETRLSPKVVHVKNVLFPAIAICSNNQISRKALNEFAGEMYEFQEQNHPQLVANSVDDLAQRLLAFGGFLMYPFDTYTKIDEQLHRLHHLLVDRYGNGTYPTRTILRLLAPRCEDLIMRCAVAGKLLNCSDLFFTRTTTVGVCCLFNYRRISYSTDRQLYQRDMNASSQSGKIQFVTSGARAALQVVLQEDPNDYTMKEYPCDGFRTLLFYPDDYPDTDTGSVTKALLGYNEEYEVSIKPDILEGAPRMKQFSSKMRHCYFLEEGQELLKQDYYSFSECMLDCRTQSVVNHCGCMIPVLPGYINNVSYCVLLDLPCISLWKAVWWQWDSFDYVSKQKMHATLEVCKQCLPSCNVMSYKINVNSRPLIIPPNADNFGVGILKGLTTSKPTTVVKFFYKSAFTQIKTHDISGDWIVLLGRYGGICSIMYGFSLVAIIECLYFVSGKWFIVWWRCLVECCRNRLRRKVESKSEHEIYWDELKPKGVFLRREFTGFD